MIATYVNKLGFSVVRENFREERNAKRFMVRWKHDRESIQLKSFKIL